MKFGTCIDAMNMDISSANASELVNCFHFQVMPLLNIDFS